MVSAVGVLALQGDCAEHLRALAELGAAPREVRRPRDLGGLTHLVLPGGESTTLARLLRLFGLWEELRGRAAAGELALFGTCAGAVLLSRSADERPPRLGLLDAEVRRNAWGRQLESAEREVALDAEVFGPEPARAPFIRAPRFGELGPRVRVLGRVAGEAGPEPVLVAQGPLLAATFHPELVGELRIHRHFLEAVRPATAASLP